MSTFKQICLVGLMGLILVIVIAIDSENSWRRFGSTTYDKINNIETSYLKSAVVMDPDTAIKECITCDYSWIGKMNSMLTYEKNNTYADNNYATAVSGNAVVINNKLIVEAESDEEDAKKIIEKKAADSKKGKTVFIQPEDNSKWLKFANLNAYSANGFSWKNGRAYYNVDGKTQSVTGIDVSVYQSDIDWQKVKAAGVDYAMIRVGFRGYSNGRMAIDKKCRRNLSQAVKAGVNVGVYFFSQAITTDEAVEEAKLTLEIIKDYKITYPVAFDTELVPDVQARTNKAKLSNKQRTDICIAYCEEVKKAGYTPMIYACKNWLENFLQVSRLDMYDIWYARYESKQPGYRYGFTMWQYSEHGSLPGIKGRVDLDVGLKNYAKILEDKEKAEKEKARFEAAKREASRLAKLEREKRAAMKAKEQKNKKTIAPQKPNAVTKVPQSTQAPTVKPVIPTQAAIVSESPLPTAPEMTANPAQTGEPVESTNEGTPNIE